ncbi:MAG: hypothetical protein R3D55_02735 [Chloroflexota bacterium]
MRYMLLLYGDEKLDENVTPEQWQATIEAHNAWTQEAIDRGMKPGGDALQPVALAKTVRFEETQATLTTDGPLPKPRAARRLLHHRLRNGSRSARNGGQTADAHRLSRSAPRHRILNN